jgi:enediyne biosynthesis protein E4
VAPASASRRGCAAGKDASGKSSSKSSADQGAAPGVEWFTDGAHETGLNFVHFNGMTGRFYQPEIMAPGVALFDYDNDGDLDVYLVQSGTIGTGTPLVPPSAGELEGRLYRNDLDVRADGTRVMRFTDVTAASGIKTRGYGMGVATGDFDNDGNVDLYITGVGGNQLFRNNGDGTFTDVSKASGAGDPASWGVSAAFLDFDRDGLLDLFVGNYLNSSPQNHVACTGVAGFPDYCRPSAYRAQPGRLYRNVGGGKFVDVTIASGLAGQFGPALGVSTADFNGDGWIDIFVANDEQENQLWINQHDGTFKNTALQAGAALGSSGSRNANMGIDAGDFDNDGGEDLIITELAGQGSTLYVNDGNGSFEEQSARTGVRAASLPYTGFGAAWLDFDNDGWLDILAVNGDVVRNTVSSYKNDPFPLGQRKLLLRNTGGRFEDVTARAGHVFDLIEAGRGAAFGDIDNDGDTDVVVANDAGPVRLLINNVGNRRHWLGLRLVGDKTDRDSLGARVVVTRSTGPTLWRRARADGSYASANDPRVLVGLGDSTEAPRIRVIWPSGRAEEWASVAIDRYTTLREGQGK